MAEMPLTHRKLILLSYEMKTPRQSYIIFEIWQNILPRYINSWTSCSAIFILSFSFSSFNAPLPADLSHWTHPFSIFITPFFSTMFSNYCIYLNNYTQISVFLSVVLAYKLPKCRDFCCCREQFLHCSVSKRNPAKTYHKLDKRLIFCVLVTGLQVPLSRAWCELCKGISFCENFSLV